MCATVAHAKNVTAPEGAAGEPFKFRFGDGTAQSQSKTSFDRKACSGERQRRDTEPRRELPCQPAGKHYRGPAAQASPAAAGKCRAGWRAQSERGGESARHGTPRGKCSTKRRKSQDVMRAGSVLSHTLNDRNHQNLIERVRSQPRPRPRARNSPWPSAAPLSGRTRVPA
jgi:hypothetical protein